jgi:hypothetical protein
MDSYPKAAMERAMKVQDVMLRAMAKKITWWQAAEILGISDRHMRRWRERYVEEGYNGLLDRRRGKPSRRRMPVATVEKVFALYREKLGWPATIPARGEPMSNLANVVQQLRKERDQAQKRIEHLDEALKALTGLGGVRGIAGRRGSPQISGAKQRTMSAAARKRIAAAQRARWAKWKAGHRGK